MEWIELLNFVLVPLTGVVTWLVARRKRDNDFLCELQKSINMLSGENHRLMTEVVELRRENIELRSIINDLNAKLENVTKITTAEKG